MSVIRDRENDSLKHERSTKRVKLDDETTTVIYEVSSGAIKLNEPTLEPTDGEAILPPSHSLLGIPSPETRNGVIYQIMESDVGISEYVGRDVPSIEGIIKQRFTDFLVYEIDLDGQVIHIKSIEKPESSPSKENSDTSLDKIVPDSMPQPDLDKSLAETEVDAPVVTESAEAHPEQNNEKEPWPERFTSTLKPFLSEEAISQVKQMFLEGKEPPRVSDSGWGGRKTKDVEGDGAVDVLETNKEESGKGGKERRGKEKGGRGRGGRGGRSGRPGNTREDHRRVLSDPISSKDVRTALHQTVRELFGGKLETETDTSAPSNDDGSRIIIKWSRRGGRGGRSDQGERAPRGTYPPYIHFTMQKTNRDTQDALAYLSRVLHVNVKDLSVAGTKDKRGVTVQRVSLKRGSKTVEDIWRLANGQPGRKSLQEALTQRGERGIRLADFKYRKASLELGMLKGNTFVITLRNVQVDTMETLDRAMNSMKHKGFINYYGMQRFGTAAIPTHSIGLALLKSDWHRAVSFILRKRPGEHPDVDAARDAWLVDGDLDKALELMPRRVVAERCILESYKKQKGETRNAMGALSTIPRNLRLMYVHAYQSYVWNAIVSERVRTYSSDRPIVGDLVFETYPDEDSEEMNIDAEGEEVSVEGANEEEPDLSSAKTHKRARKPWKAPRVKALTAEDLNRHTIFDVIMPLPGTDVDYPGGELGEKYRAYLKADGLDPDNFVRKQKEYTLTGSYRKILHLPTELSWSILHYTDPDVALAQADEDKLLGFDPPAVVEDGKFLALQIDIALGTASYATMAIREVTKTETSSHFQTGLTRSSEDQKYRGEGAQ